MGVLDLEQAARIISQKSLGKFFSPADEDPTLSDFGQLLSDLGFRVVPAQALERGVKLPKPITHYCRNQAITLTIRFVSAMANFSPTEQHSTTVTATLILLNSVYVAGR